MRGKTPLCFGGRNVLYDASSSHFLFAGATRSGKSLSIRLLLQSVLGVWTLDRVPTRMLVYDAKRELLPVLYGMFKYLDRTDAAEKILLLNPFDRRAVAWDIAADITSPAHAYELACLMIPSDGGSGKFWSDGARAIVAAVIDSFVLFKSKWTLGDVCRAIESYETLESVIGRKEETAFVLDQVLSEEKTRNNFFATMGAYMFPFRILSALWERAERKISLRQWLREGEGVLVLGASQTAETSIAAVNRMLFQRMSQIILDELPELRHDDPDRTWIVLDEFCRAGQLSGMVNLATAGASKGVSIIISLQDIDGMRAVYGREITNEILGQFSNIALLRLNSVSTAEWAASVVGHYRAIEESQDAREGLTIGSDVSLQQGGGASLRMLDRPALLASYFQRLPLVQRSAGVHALFISPNWVEQNNEAVEVLITKRWMFEEGFIWPAADVLGFDPLPDDAGRLKPWKVVDRHRLGIPVITGAATRKGASN